MLTGIQTLPKVTLLPISLGVTRRSELPDNSKLLETRTSQPAVLPLYAESDYHWLVGVLDKLIEFARRDENHSVPELTENDYDWAHALLVELVGAVGESETHPLRPLMEFVCRLIDNYEDKYVPELTELFPELAEEGTTEVASRNRQHDENTPKPKLSENELAAHAFFSIGYLLSEGKKVKKALSAYDMAITLKPDFVEAYHNRALGLQQIHKYEAAIIDLEQAIRLDPDSSELHYKLGCIKGCSNQWESAIADFDKVIKLDPNCAEAYCCRGLMKSELDEYKSAIADFDKAIELNLNPDFVDIHYIKGIVNAQFKQYEEAIADFDEAIRLNPDDAKAYDSRGIVKGLLKRYESAISDHTTAIDIMPDFAEAYAHRGAAKVELGNIDEARSDLQAALTLAEQQGNTDFKTLVEKGLRRLNQMDSKHKNQKKPRRGGQWKGQVKISEGFDELPESFMACFDGEDE